MVVLIVNPGPFYLTIVGCTQPGLTHVTLGVYAHVCLSMEIASQGMTICFVAGPGIVTL